MIRSLHELCCSGIGPNDGNWNQRAYICRRRQQGFEIAEDSPGNGMDSIRLFMTLSSLEQIGGADLFLCCDPFSTQKMCVEGILKILCLALVFSLLWFSRDLRGALTLWS